MLELEVVPERSLGNEHWEFVLGMPLSQAVYIIQRQCTAVKKAEIQYSDSRPLSIDLVLNLSQDGIRLIFDSCSQSLKIIEVYDFSKVSLKYCSVTFSTPQGLATVDQIDQSFGATHPGVYDSTQQLFVLDYRGLSFSFSIDSKFQPHYTHGLGSLQFPNGASPSVSRMCIYSGSKLTETKAPPLPLTCFHGTVYLDSLEVVQEDKLIIGIKCNVLAEGIPQNRLVDNAVKKVTVPGVVKFGETEQDVLGCLGCPSKLFFKSEDKMKIHSAGAHKQDVKAKCSDYFYNYFSMGLDILFDARTHTVKKFILHTNYPGHYNFNIYNRCSFKVPVYASTQEESATQLQPGTRANSKGGNMQSQPLSVNTFTKWDTIQKYIKMKPDEWKPVVLNRSSSTNTTNPFGSTFCYGINNVVFEVMANNHIASVTIYPHVRS